LEKTNQKVNSIYLLIILHKISRRVCADQEDGVVEVDETPFTYTISVV
jgi:hypothetical protein